MMRTRFQLGLDELKERLLEMGGMAEAAIELAADAYRCLLYTSTSVTVENILSGLITLAGLKAE